MKTITLADIIPESLTNERLDIVCAKLFSQYSRAQLQQWIRNGFVSVNQRIIKKPRWPVNAGQQIALSAQLTDKITLTPQFIPLSIVYEDNELLVVNKPAGLVVHPGAGNPDHTLVNALLHYAPELSTLPRAGIVHRLDKDTSGLLMVARTLSSHHALVSMLQRREVHREYQALVCGTVISGGTIDEPIARHPTQRTKMSVIETGKSAITHYRVLERFEQYTLLSVTLETGRTHQIRVHLTHIGYPVVGDPVYTKRYCQNTKSLLTRQALHAYRLKLPHPVTHQLLEWTAPLPEEINMLINQLRIQKETLKKRH